MVKRKSSTRNEPVASSRSGSTAIPSGRSTRTVNPLSDPFSKDLLRGFGDAHDAETTLSGDALLGLLGNQDYLSILMQLVRDNSNMQGDERSREYQKQLLEMLLEQITRQEQRGYDESVLHEQRNFDSPTNQLARLMGAGVSRDAAIQMLSGVSESPLVGSGSGTDVSSVDPTANELARKQMAMDAVFGAFGAVTSLVSLGFSVPQAIQQTKMLSNSNFLTEFQLEAYDNAGLAFQILSSAGVALDSVGSATAAARSISQLAESGNEDAKLFVENGGVQSMLRNAPFTSRTLRNLAMDERGYSDHATQFSQQYDLNEAELDLKKVNKEQCLQQIVNLQEQVKEIQADIRYKDALTALQAWNQLVLEKQGKKIDAETKALNLQNQQLEDFLNTEVDGYSGKELITAQRALACYNQMKSLIAQKDTALWEDEVNAMAANYQLLTDMYTLRSMYFQGASEWFSNNPDLAAMCSGFEECGGWSYIDNMIKIHSRDNSLKFGPVSFSSSGVSPFGDIMFYGHTKGGQYQLKWQDWQPKKPKKVQ